MVFFAIDVSFVIVAFVTLVRGNRVAAAVWFLGAMYNGWLTYTTARKWLREAEAACTQSVRVSTNERTDKIALKLGARLHAVATERHIPIRYVADAEMGRAAGQYTHTITRDPWGRKRHVAHEIRLNRERFTAPERGSNKWSCLTLAHEIGHHIASYRANDYSEEAADREAMRLVRSLLTDDEREAVEPILIAVEQAQAKGHA